MRHMLDGGRLGIIVVDAPERRHRAPARTWTAPAVEAGCEREIVHAGVDGEAVDLAPPLRIAVRPVALRVRVLAPRPRRSPARS